MGADQLFDGVRGTITAENGSTWTVNPNNGTVDTVTITPRRNSAQDARALPRSSSRVCSAVQVSGTANSNTITANRSTATRPKTSASTAPTAPPSVIGVYGAEITASLQPGKPSRLW